MKILAIVILTIINIIISLIIFRFYKLFVSKEHFSKNEFIEIIQTSLEYFISIFSPYRLWIFYALLSTIVAYILTLLFNNWLFQSAIIPAIIYVSFVFSYKQFNEQKVTISDSQIEQLSYNILNYRNIITLFYSNATLATITYSWITVKSFSFFWFFLNGLAIFIFMIYLFNNINNDFEQFMKNNQNE